MRNFSTRWDNNTKDITPEDTLARKKFQAFWRVDVNLSTLTSQATASADLIGCCSAVSLLTIIIIIIIINGNGGRANDQWTKIKSAAGFSNSINRLHLRTKIANLSCSPAPSTGVCWN